MGEWLDGWMKIEIDDLKKVNLGPDDVLVLSMKKTIPERHAKAIGYIFKKIFPNNELIILEDGATLETVKKAGLEPSIYQTEDLKFV